MKRRIALPIAGGVLCSHFGHCEQFYFADVAEGRIENETVITPPAHEPGLYPAWVREQGASVVIAGGMGTKARDLFAKENISLHVGAELKAPRALVEDLLSGKLTEGDNSCNHTGNSCNH